MERYDLIIIGGGAAGFAMKANELKANTLLINDNVIGIGGTCVNVGCVPTKYLLHIGALIHKLKNLNFQGMDSSVSFEYKKLVEEKNVLIQSLQAEKYRNVLNELSYVRFQEGSAQFISRSEIQLETHEIFKADNILIATGSSLIIPPIKGIETTALQLMKLPNSLIVIGGGALGLEFAQLFFRFGVHVIVLELMDAIIPNEEPEISSYLQNYLQEEGIEIFTKIKKKTWALKLA